MTDTTTALQFDRQAINSISGIISNRLSLIIVNNTNVKWNNSLATNIKTSFHFAFLSLTQLLWDNPSLSATKKDIDVGLIYSALGPYVAKAEEYAKKQQTYTLPEQADIAANYMLLAFIRDHHEALFDLCFSDDFIQEIQQTNVDSDIRDAVDIANCIKNILHSRVSYIIKG